MSIPKPERITDLVRSIEAVNLRKIREDLSAAVKRERECGTNRADGYSSGGGGGGSGHGDPTVSALLSRQNRNQDRLRNCTHDAVKHLEQAVKSLTMLEGSLHALSAVQADAPITPASCELCATAGLKDRPWEHRGNVAGKLTRDMYLCNAHLQYVSRNGTAPSVEQTQHWDRTGSWRVREAG